MAWTIARARFETDLFFARALTLSSVSRSSAPPGPRPRRASRAPRRRRPCDRSSCATLSSSAGSAMRATASSAVCGSAAFRATLLSALTSCTRPSAAARTVSCGDVFATVENCFGSSSPSSASAASASVPRRGDRDRDEPLGDLAAQVLVPLGSRQSASSATSRREPMAARRTRTSSSPRASSRAPPDARRRPEARGPPRRGRPGRRASIWVGA